MSKEEYIKKIKTKIKRTKVSVMSWYTGHDMTSKIKNLDLDIIKINNQEYFDINVKKIEVCHKIHEVNHRFQFRLLFDNVEIKNCKYLDDGFYSINYLQNINNYEMWKSNFRETMWCIFKALSKERFINYGNE